ncbi:MAG TPA: class I SAM-dependent methyltransferase [Thermoplasmata archaeon]|nr:class I SAM-dependent methyltransferase [Thermoplasmata archaeon]
MYSTEIRERYRTGDTPWDSGVPSAEIGRVVDEGGLPGRRLLELGCGTGTNAVELARRGYAVTAVDLVDLAVQKAREKARAAGVSVDFRVGDLTKVDLGGPFESLVDLGVYHGIRARNLAGLLDMLQGITRPGARWLSLAGNAREVTPNGPPVVTEVEVRSELEPRFKILQLREFRFNLRPDFQPLAWSILMERR